MIDINHRLVCEEKRVSEMLDCAADVLFYRSAGEEREDPLISCFSDSFPLCHSVSSSLLPELLLSQNVCFLSHLSLFPLHQACSVDIKCNQVEGIRAAS